MKSIVAILFGAACVMAAIATRPAFAQSAGAALPIFVDYTPPPSQIKQLTSVVDAVVVGRIESTRFESIVDPRVGRAQDVTRYDVRIAETLKAHAMLAPNQQMLMLTRLGGQHSENGTVVRSAVVGFEDFLQNGEYVLFLTWNQSKNEFDIAYGPDGSYHLDPSGTVRPLGRSAVAKSEQGKGRAAFLQELRIASSR